MHGANTGSTARQDLAALGHIAAELCGVLIVDGRCLIDAELANFSALTILGVVLIESQSCILLSIILCAAQKGSSPSPSSSSEKGLAE